MTVSLSIVMPVRNALPYLDEAVESILGQSYAEFEFIIRDDRSTDGSLERLRFWAARDPRIRLFEGEASLGPVGSSNFVVQQARGKLVARMDGDDISWPHRLRRQVEILNRNPEAVLVGSLMDSIDAAGARVREPDFSRLRSNGFFSPFPHGSIMFRREAFDRAGGYRDGTEYWEDLDLYARLRSHGLILVLAEPLYSYRFSDTSARLTSSSQAKVENALDLVVRCKSALERGEDYDHLLEDPGDPQRRVDPWAVLAIAFLAIWSGGRPKPLTRLRQRGRLAWDRRTFKALAIAGWTELSPRSLRHVGRHFIRWRSRKARLAIGVGQILEWPARASEPESSSAS